MRHGYKIIFLICVITTASTLYPTRLSAQTQQDPLTIDELSRLSLAELMDIRIYSASKHPQRPPEVPASIVVVTREDIATYGYFTVADILRNVAGFYSIYDYDEDLFGVRSVLGGEIALLVNGVLQHTNQFKHILFNAEVIERIEIVRGPQSIIYGNGAFLGSINIITHAGEQKGSRVAIGQGSEDSQTFSLNSSFGDGGTTTSLLVSSYKTDGVDINYRDVMSPSAFAAIPSGARLNTDGSLQRSNQHLMLRMENQNLSAQFQYNHTSNEWYVLTPSFDDGNEEKTDIFTGFVEYQLAINDFAQLKADIIYSTYNEHRDYDFIDAGLIGQRNIQTRRLQPELLLTLDPNTDWNAIVGLTTTTIYGGSYALNIPFLELDVSIEDDDVRSRALFGEVNYQLAQQWEVVAGLRIEQDLAYTSRRSGRDDTPSGVVTIHADEKRHYIPRLALLYSPTQQQTIKLLYGEATRSGAVIDSEIREYNNRETIDNLESIYLYSNQSFLFSGSIFYSKVNHLQRFFQQYDPVLDEFQTFFDDSGELIIQGVELAARIIPSNRLAISAGTTITDVEDKKNGFDVGNAPALLAKIAFDYSWKKIRFGVGGNYVGSMRADWNMIDAMGREQRIGNDVDSYFSLDCNLTYSVLDNFSVNAYFKNITNADIRYPASFDAPFQQGLLHDGRRFFLTAAYHF